MIRSDKKTIGGGTYELTQLAGVAGLKVYRKLHKWVLPALAAVTKVLGDEGGAKVALRDALPDLAERIGDLAASDEGWALIEELLVGLRYNGQPVNHNAHWPEHYGDLYEVVWFALQLNFGAVFRDAAGRLQPFLERAAAAVQASPSPQT